jgi:hypothetical protein
MNNVAHAMLGLNNRAFGRIGAALLIGLAAAPAAATAVIPAVPANIGANWTVTYDARPGNSDTVVTPGVTASISFTLVGLLNDNRTWRVLAEVANTSTVGTAATGARLGAFSFDTDPNLASVRFFDKGDFNFIGTGGNMTGGLNNVEFCVGVGSNNCSGGGNNGIRVGEVGDTVFDLTFLGPAPDAIRFSNFFVRWQVLPSNPSSGVGRMTGITIDGNGDPDAVPEPSSWAMLIAGFGLVGAAARRRKRAGAAAAA